MKFLKKIFGFNEGANNAAQRFEFDGKLYKPYDFGCLIVGISLARSESVIEDGLLKINDLENNEVLYRISSNLRITQHYTLPYVLSAFTAATLFLNNINIATAKEFQQGIKEQMKSPPIDSNVGEILLSFWALFSPEILNELTEIKKMKMGFENIRSGKTMSIELINGINNLNTYKIPLDISDSDLEKIALTFRSAAALILKICIDHKLKVIS